MKRIVMCLLLGSWAVAIAQAPPGEERAAGADEGEQVPPCVSVTDALQAPAGVSGPLESQPKDAGQASVPCEEQDPEATPGEEQDPEAMPGEEQDAEAMPGEEQDAEATPGEEQDAEAMPGEEQDPETTPGEEQDSAEVPGEIFAGPETIEEDDSDIEATAEGEFKPGDEISEDYPVPLPSDI
jgi:hypothetical protein